MDSMNLLVQFADILVPMLALTLKSDLPVQLEMHL